MILKISFFILISITSYSQKKFAHKLTKVDSATLKIEIDKVLSKYGLKSKGFNINVISLDQKGGQTAYSITNNYYKDTAYIEDSVNFDYTFEKQSNNTILYVYPKYGVWHEPFVYHDSSIHEQLILMSGSVTPLPTGLSLSLENGIKYQMVGDKCSSIISKNSPLVLRLLPDYINAIYIFGDNSNEKKSYELINEKIIWKPF